MAEPRDTKDKQFARTLARGIAVLRAFGPGTQAMGNGELSVATGLDRSTVARLTYTLVRSGLLEHDRSLRKYRLGVGVLKLGYPLLSSLLLRQVARPHMQRLATTLIGTVGLGTRHLTEMVYLDAVVDQDDSAPDIDRGLSTALLTSAMGNAWLACAEPAEREPVLNRLRVDNPELYARHGGRVGAALREYRDRGFCASKGDRSPDRCSVATALRQRLNGQIIVFDCTVSMAVAPEATDDLVRQLGQHLVEMVRSIEAASGTTAALAGEAGVSQRRRHSRAMR